jgi:hypothetical protein
MIAWRTDDEACGLDKASGQGRDDERLNTLERVRPFCFAATLAPGAAWRATHETRSLVIGSARARGSENGISWGLISRGDPVALPSLPFFAAPYERISAVELIARMPISEKGNELREL